jgi:hypothetical protein
MNRVMAGHSRSKNGVTSRADVPAMTIPIKFHSERCLFYDLLAAAS